MTRCHDSQCTARNRCERYHLRHERAAGIRQALTLKPAWIPHNQPCQRYIRRGISPSELLEQGPAGWLTLGWLRGQCPTRVLLGLINSRHHCWTKTPQRHPWDARITDLACGYDDRLADTMCTGCHRQRQESPLDQLAALDHRHTADGRA